MNICRTTVCCIAWLPIVASHWLSAQSPIYFEEAVAPILRKNCLACHNATLSEAGLNLETPAKLIQGGDAGSTINAQNIAASLLLTRASGAVEPIMPPADNTVGASRLTPEQLETLRAWIAGGALFKGEPAMQATHEMKLPDSARASFAVAASANGDFIAMGRGNKIILHDARKLSATMPATASIDPIPLQVIENAHPDYVHSIAISADGQTIATGSTGQVKLWKRDAPSFDAVRKSLEANGNLVTTADSSVQALVVFSDVLSATLVNRALQILQVKSSELTEPIADHPLVLAVNGTGPIDAVALSPDKTRLLTSTWDDAHTFTTLRLWDVPEAKLIGLLDRGRAEQTAFSNAGRVAHRQQVSVDRTAKTIEELDKAVQAEANAIKQSTESRDKVAKLLADKEAEKLSANQSVIDHEKMMADTKAAIEAATKQLETLTAELEPKKKKAMETDKQSLNLQQQVEIANQTILTTEQAQQAAVARLDSTKQLSATRTAELAVMKSASESEKVKNEAIRFKADSIAFANDKTIVACSTDPNSQVSALELFSVDTRERYETQLLERKADALVLNTVAMAMAQPTWKLDRSLESTNWISDRVTALAFDPTGSRLAIGSGLPSRSGKLAIINVADGQWVSNPVSNSATSSSEAIELHSDTILGLAYSPDGKWLASCGADKMTKLIDTGTNTVVKVLEGHTHHVLAVAWQEDGFKLATASADMTIKIWDAERGEVDRTIAGFGAEVTSLGFLAGTSNLFSSSINNIPRLHDMNDARLVRQYSSAGDSLYGVATAPSGKFAMAVGQEGALRVWATEDGRLAAELK
jgi:WD40 repeat protein